MSARTALWKQPPDGHEWLALCLRFANTADWHASAHPTESLTTYHDLVTWGVSGGLISPGATARLMQRVSSQPGRARAALARAIEAREVIYRIMSALAHGREPAGRDVTALNEALRAVLGRSRLGSDAARGRDAARTGNAGRFVWEITGRVDEFDRVLWPVLKSAADLLTSPELRRVKQCADDRGCGLLFLDRSKNLSRRWCSMKSCGNRAKVLTHNRRRVGTRSTSARHRLGS